MKSLAQGLKLLLAPLGRRLGTATAVLLGSQGVPPDTVEKFVVAAGIVLALGFDIAVAIYHERSSR